MAAEERDDFKDAKLGGYVGAILFGGSGIVFLILLLVAIGGTIYDWNRSGSVPVGAWIAIPALVLSTAAFGLLAAWSLRRLRTWKRLEAQPVTAWGTLREVRPSATKINTRRLFVFTMTVTPTTGPPYEAEARWFLPPDLQPAVVPGLAVALRVDPLHPTSVVIDWPQTRSAGGAGTAHPGADPTRG